MNGKRSIQIEKDSIQYTLHEMKSSYWTRWAINSGDAATRDHSIASREPSWIALAADCTATTCSIATNNTNMNAKLKRKKKERTWNQTLHQYCDGETKFQRRCNEIWCLPMIELVVSCMKMRTGSWLSFEAWTRTSANWPSLSGVGFLNVTKNMNHI